MDNEQAARIQALVDAYRAALDPEDRKIMEWIDDSIGRINDSIVAKFVRRPSPPNPPTPDSEVIQFEVPSGYRLMNEAEQLANLRNLVP